MNKKPEPIEGFPFFSQASLEKGYFKLVSREFDGEKIDVIFRKGKADISQKEIDDRLAKGEEIHQFSVGPKWNSRSYTATKVIPHVVCRQDVPVELRDGTVIYADIYTPKNTTEPLPLLIAWGPFGKRPAEGMDEFNHHGVPLGTVSTMNKFEGCDPGYWCHNGYAVANVDPRGIGHSQGDVYLWGTQDGQDGYDFIEWAAAQEWCNGRIAMFGNSALAMVQWRIAAEQPPHLTCIAVWEGTGDMYRESLCLGGIPTIRFEHYIISRLLAGNYIEDNANMILKYPLMNKFWEDKIPRWDRIKIPAYLCAGLCHTIHLRGSLEGFHRIGSEKKWIRIHREHEWTDAYNPKNLEDLKKFYDRYLKDIRNGWELTSKVRVDVMDAYEYDFKKERPDNEFPLERTVYKKFYLNAADRKLYDEPVATANELVYDPDKDAVSFVYKFTEDTEITGYMKVNINLECRDYDNMDLQLWVTKYKEDGTFVPLKLMGIENRGAYSYYRASRRELDEKWSTDYQPVQAHRRDEPMEEGKIYECEIPILPHSRFWHKGEELHLEIYGYVVPSGQTAPPTPYFDNGGKHVIHTGGNFNSYLQIPVVPPKYQSGEFKYYD
ncbi:MAG: CocE/NonD family hydrolase [Treponema sp.]|nr:CocE/NonD family hydrolase [Treponema sp.]